MAMQSFKRKIGRMPGEMIGDRDFRIIGKHVENALNGSLVSGAPSGKQTQNGLCEINWRYLCNIARNYLAEHLLPPDFWYFAIRYAVQVSNYMPIKNGNGKDTTPFFLAYATKPDYRKLSPLFSVAYVKIYQSAEESTLMPQTIPAILVGNDDKSDGKLFYNPATKHLLGSSDFRLDTSHASGPLFKLPYRANDYFLHSEMSDVSPPPL